MARRKPTMPTKGELRVMNVVWEQRWATGAADIVGALSSPALSNATVLPTLRVLEQKNVVARTSDTRGRLYHPLIERTKAATLALRDRVQSFLHNSKNALVVRLVEAEPPSKDEFGVMRTLIAAYQKEHSG